MLKTYNYILLLVFVGFLVSMSTNFSLYMKVLNTGTLVEDVNSVPEEQHEKSGDSKFKNFTSAEPMLLNSQLAAIYHYHNYQFSLIENIYIDVPYPPPEVI